MLTVGLRITPIEAIEGIIEAVEGILRATVRKTITMSQIKLDLEKMPLPSKILFARQVITALTNNTHFPSPEPTLAQLEAQASTTETAYNTAQASRQKAIADTATQNDEEKQLDVILTRLGSYVQLKSSGDEVKIRSAGMQVKSPKTPIGPLGAPESVALGEGASEGSLIATWARVRGAVSYVVELTTDPAAKSGWTHAVSTKTQHTLTGLTSGTRYWCRIAAVGAAGQGPFSDPAAKVAP